MQGGATNTFVALLFYKKKKNTFIAGMFVSSLPLS